MDKFGVPKEVNRHVIKAIYKGLEKPNLSNICNFVDREMKNNVPVPFLQSVVRQSLQNLNNLGVIEKKGTNYHRKENVDSFLPIPSKHINTNIFKRTVRTENESNLNPNRRKRANLSEESIPENDPKSSLKRIRTSKTLSRKGQEVYLPKARISQNFDQLNYNIVETQYEWSPGSDSVEEKTTLISRIEPSSQTTENQSSDDLLKSNENIHKMIDSQTQTNILSKCNIKSVQVLVRKLDVFNESGLELYKQSEVIKSSQRNQISNQEQKGPTMRSDTEEPLNSNSNVYQENDNDESFVQSKLILNETPKSPERNETKNEEQKEAAGSDTVKTQNGSTIKDYETSELIESNANTKELVNEEQEEK